jgi:hypothetical protein
MRTLLPLTLLVCVFLTVPCAHAGRIIVNHDEWTTSDFGFSQAGANAATFARNVASYLNPVGGPGNFLAYSDDFSLTESDLAGALASAGHSLTVSSAVTFELPTLLAYDAILLAGQPGANPAVLTQYVNAGGNVYLAAGTFLGGDANGEAAAWNPFLNNFGLTLRGAPYNLVVGTLPVTGTHEIFTGVSNLYYNNGNTVALFGSKKGAEIVQTSAGGFGLIAVFEPGGDPGDLPEPASMTLLGAGLLAMAFLRKARTRA